MELQKRIDRHTQSLFLEEYLGDLGQAYDEILQHESQPNDPEQTAYLLESKTKVYMLLGRLRDAYTTLDEFKILVDDHIFGSSSSNSTTTKKLASYWGLRYAVCKALVDSYRRHPPCLRYQHDPQSPTNTSMIGSITGSTYINAELVQNVQRYSANIAEEDAATHQTDFQMCLLVQVLVNFPQQLRFLIARHPAYPDGVWKQVDQKSSEEAIAEAASYLKRFVERKPIEEEVSVTSLYLHRLYIELFTVVGSISSRDVLLQKLHDAYKGLDHQAGMANCKLLEADSLLSPPFTNPISQNLIPTSTSNATGENIIWEPIEAKYPLRDSEKANQCYEEALVLFQQSNSPRGQAAVLLRQASILHARACALDPRNTTERIRLLEAASEKYDKSLNLFGMDEANAQIVKANQILLDISKGGGGGHPTIAELKKRAGEIGKWGIERQNELVSYHLCLLMIRFARREWRTYSRFDTANACYECAYECSMELGGLLPAFIALFSSAEMQGDMNNIAAATVLVDRCITMVDSVVESMNRQIDAIGQDSPLKQVERDHMLNKKNEFISSFSQAVSQILAKRNALDSYQKWEQKFFWYVENDESFASLRMEISQDEGHRSELTKKVFGTSLGEMMNVATLEDAISKQFWAASIEFGQFISKGSLDNAESAMHRFIEKSQKYRKIYTRELFQILAYNKLADTPKVRQILDSMTDSELFKGRLDEFLEGKNVNLFFPLLANNAIYACMIAQDWKRGLRMVDLTRRILPELLDESPTEALVDVSMRQVSVAAIYLNSAHPELAFRMLLKARELTELGRRHASDVDVKVGALSRERTVDIFLLLVDICLQCAELNLPICILDGYSHGHPNVSWEEHALLFMEEARARSLVDSLLSAAEKQPNEEESRKISESIYKRRALTHLQSISERTAQQEKELEELAQEIERLDIGTWSSSANDLMNTLNSGTVLPHDLFGHLNNDTVVIEASFSGFGCILIACTNQGIQAYQKTPVRDVDIRRPVMELMQVMSPDVNGPYDDLEEEDRKARVEKLSGQVSDVILTPFAEIVRQKRHVIFSVSQPLTAFPFSALMFDGKPLFLHAAVSQTPSLTVLYHLSKRRATASVPTVSVFTKSLSQDQEAPSTEEQTNEEPFLEMAGIEAINISNMFSTWPIEASTLSRVQFRDHIQSKTSILHIGTHGTLNSANTLLSSISIGEDFRVLDLSSIQSGANLLVFAACLSGLGRATAGNDVLGFTHVVLGTGCQAYIGTLFKVDDFASMVLMTLFYRQIKTRPGLSLAEALRCAQVEFWHFDAVKAAAFLDGLIDVWDAISASASLDGGKRSPDDIVPDGRYLLTLQKMLLSQIDWTSPIFWAPFSLMGYGDFCFTS